MDLTEGVRLKNKTRGAPVIAGLIVNAILFTLTPITCTWFSYHTILISNLFLYLILSLGTPHILKRMSLIPKDTPLPWVSMPLKLMALCLVCWNNPLGLFIYNAAFIAFEIAISAIMKDGDFHNFVRNKDTDHLAMYAVRGGITSTSAVNVNKPPEVEYDKKVTGVISGDGRWKLSGKKTQFKLKEKKGQKVEAYLKNGLTVKAVFEDGSEIYPTQVWVKQGKNKYVLEKIFLKNITEKYLNGIDECIIKNIYADGDGRVTVDGAKNMVKVEQYANGRAQVTVKRGIVAHIKFPDIGKEISLTKVYKKGVLVDSFNKIVLPSKFSKCDDVTVENFFLSKNGALEVGGRIWFTFMFQKNGRNIYSGAKVKFRIKKGLITTIDVLRENGKVWRHVDMNRVYDSQGNLVDVFDEMGSKWRDKLKRWKEKHGSYYIKYKLSKNGAVHIGKLWASLKELKGQWAFIHFREGIPQYVISPDSWRIIPFKRVYDKETGKVLDAFLNLNSLQAKEMDGVIVKDHLKTNRWGRLQMCGFDKGFGSAHANEPIEAEYMRGKIVRIISQETGAELYPVDMSLKEGHYRRARNKYRGTVFDSNGSEVEKFDVLRGWKRKFSDWNERYGDFCIKYRFASGGKINIGKQWGISKKFSNKTGYVYFSKGYPQFIVSVDGKTVIPFKHVYSKETGEILDVTIKIDTAKIRQYGHVIIKNLVRINKQGYLSIMNFSKYFGILYAEEPVEMEVKDGEVLKVVSQETGEEFFPENNIKEKRTKIHSELRARKMEEKFREAEQLLSEGRYKEALSEFRRVETEFKRSSIDNGKITRARLLAYIGKCKRIVRQEKNMLDFDVAEELYKDKEYVKARDMLRRIKYRMMRDGDTDNLPYPKVLLFLGKCKSKLEERDPLTIKKYYNEKTKIDRETQIFLIDRINGGDEDARNMLVETYVWMVKDVLVGTEQFSSYDSSVHEGVIEMYSIAEEFCEQNIKGEILRISLKSD